jgi:hypothetical protein
MWKTVTGVYARLSFAKPYVADNANNSHGTKNGRDEDNRSATTLNEFEKGMGIHHECDDGGERRQNTFGP